MGRKLKTLGIRGALFVGFGVIIAIVVVLTTFALRGIRHMANDVENFYEGPYTINNNVLVIAQDFYALSRNMKDAALASKSEDVGAFSADSDRRLVQIHELMDKLDKVADDRDDLKIVVDTVEAWKPVRSRVIEAVRNGNQTEAATISVKEAEPLLTKATDALNRMSAKMRKEAEDVATQATKKTWQIWGFLLASNLVAAVVLVLIVFKIAKVIATPLNDAVRVAEYVITSNDFKQTVPMAGPTEVRRVGQAFNDLMDKFRGILTDAGASSRQVTEEAQALAASSRQVEEISAAQNDATATVAAAIEQASVSASETSRNADSAMAEVAQADADTQAAMKVMGDMISNVRSVAALIDASAKHVAELSESSKQIGNIVQVIQDVADQTNLLALNAAIEAARAGEQGRGFAVVADEVRKLAERTSEATQEIAGLIGSIQQGVGGTVSAMNEATGQVSNSLKLVENSDAALQRVVGSSQKVSDNVSAISSAIKEQDAAIHQVAENVEKIAQGAEKNNVAVRTNNATSKRLDELAEGLYANVARFKV